MPENISFYSRLSKKERRNIDKLVPIELFPIGDKIGDDLREGLSKPVFLDEQKFREENEPKRQESMKRGRAANGGRIIMPTPFGVCSLRSVSDIPDIVLQCKEHSTIGS